MFCLKQTFHLFHSVPLSLFIKKSKSIYKVGQFMPNFELWYLFPAGIVIAALATSSGISGANFWIPVYLIGLKVSPNTGFCLALFTMFFGFGSAVLKNMRSKTINWYLVNQYLKVCLPASLIGGYLSTMAPQGLLVAIFGIFVLAYGSYLLYKGCTQVIEKVERHNKIFWGMGLIAGFLKGLLVTGLGKLILPCYINHQRIKHHSEAVGTTVTILFIVNLCAFIGRVNSDLLNTLSNERSFIISVLFWVVPSVIIGGQIGPHINQKLSKIRLCMFMGGLLIFVGGLTFLRAFPI